MSDYSITANQVACHITMTPNTVDTVTFQADLAAVQIVTRDGSAAIWYTIDGSTPTAGGPGTYVIPAGVIGSDERQPTTAGNTVVKLVSTGSPTVSVQRAT